MRSNLNRRKGIETMGKVFEKLTLDEERALYGEQDIEVRRCLFDGPADG